MSYPWQQNIAGIFADDSDTIVGTGALVRAEQCGLCILTCAHALNEARQFDPYNAQHHGDHQGLQGPQCDEWIATRQGLVQCAE